MSHTYTYTILKVSHETYEDVRRRLIDAVSPATSRELDGNLIILGSLALECEREECNP